MTSEVDPSLHRLRPPATPLAVRSMYLSTWLAGDNLAGQWPTFWNGSVTGMAGIVRVDGAAFVFAGAPDVPRLPLLDQVSLTVTATQSTYLFHGGGIRLTVNFLSPVDPGDLRRQSVPMSYLTIQADSADGRAHHVSVYLDITGEWAHGDRDRPIDWSHHTVGAQLALSFAPTEPTVLAEQSEQASWGTVVFAADENEGLTWQIAEAAAARTNGADGALPNSAETGPRAIDDRWPVFAFNQDFGSISPTTTAAPMVLTIGHVRAPAVSYLGTALDPWWRSYWPDWPAMLTWFRTDYDTALSRSSDTDARIVADVTRIFGADNDIGRQYAAICSLALRQAVAGTELVDQGGKPWAMLKEISSNGNMCTVDVLYPALPAFLYLAPNYLRLLLEPVLAYVEAGHWPQPFAPHDLGILYPNATAHNDGGGENMPVEESANMLIMSAALIARLPDDEAAGFVSAHYPVLRGWAEYLVANALDPDHQNQTDDFTGFIAHSSNLALKGIIGIGAMGLIAEVAGHTADETRYRTTATDYLPQWVTKSQDSSGKHLKLAYDQDGTWSLKYNGYPDRLLGLGLVPDDVAAREAAWYIEQANAFGVELDPRHTYTKADWELWTAGFLVDQTSARDLLVQRVYRFADETVSRVPFTDWYDTNSGERVGFAARPVIGGVFSLLALLDNG